MSSATKEEIVLSLESNFSTLRTILDLYQEKVKEYITQNLSLQNHVVVNINLPAYYGNNYMYIDVLDENKNKAFGTGITIQYANNDYSFKEKKNIDVSIGEINFPSYSFNIKDEKRNYMISHLNILSFVATNSIELEKIMIEMVENIKPLMDANSLLQIEKSRIEKEEKDAITKAKEEEFTTIKIGTKLVGTSKREYEVINMTPKFITLVCGSIESKHRIEDFKDSFLRGKYELI